MGFSTSFVLTGALSVNGARGQKRAGHSTHMLLGSLAARSPLLPAALPVLPTALLSHQQQQLPRASPCLCPCRGTRALPQLPGLAPHGTRAAFEVCAGSTEPVPVEFPCPALRLPVLPDAGDSLLPWPCPCSLWSLQRVTRNSPRPVPGGSW